MSRLSDFADSVHVALNDATVEKVIGQKNGNRHGKRRRLHWYRISGQIVPARQTGGTEENGNRSPTELTRLETVQCNVFAETEDTLDVLIDNVIAAIQGDAPGGSVQWGDYTWAHDEYAKRGVMVPLTFEIRLPVLSEQKALVTITDEDLTCEIDEDL